MLFTTQLTVPKVPSPELENETIPDNFDPSSDLTVAVQVVEDPDGTLAGEHFTEVEV